LRSSKPATRSSSPSSFEVNSGPDTVTETLTLTIDGVNDAPRITNANLGVSQGGTVVLSAADIGVIDPDDDGSFTFHRFRTSPTAEFQTTADGSDVDRRHHLHDGRSRGRPCPLRA
jgi:hypothetical protein